MRADTDGYEDWLTFAGLFAVVPEEPWHVAEIHKRVGAFLATHTAHGFLPVEFVLVFNLMEDITWIADRSHDPESWPDRQRAQGRLD